MLFSNTIVGLVAVAVAGVSATGVAQPAVTATSSPFKVSVGADGLTYTPNNIIAEVGTKIEFSFFPKNHTVTQSSFKDPCHPLSSGGFFSGFVPTTDAPSGTTFTITVTDTKPIWFYCSQTKGAHCQAGMVGAINAPATGNTLDAFILLASNASTSTFPLGGPTGGEIASGSSASASSQYSTVYTTTANIPVVTTYTNAAGTAGTTTIGSTAIITTVSSVVGGATSPPITPASGASSMVSNSMAATLALVLSAMALL